jgi:cell division protein FtsB
MKWFNLALAALVLVLQYRIWLSPHGAREVLQLGDAVELQRAENQKLHARNGQLAAEVRDLTQGYEALEERARSELGLIGSAETYYQVVPRTVPGAGEATEPAPATPTALAAAR